MTTNEKNRMIAEFMGGTIQDNGSVRPYPEYIPSIYFEKYNFDTLWASNYEYDTSWDWLMPVVKRISEEMPCNLPEELNDFTDSFHFGLYEADITKLYSACVQFIQWYTTQQKEAGDE